MIKLNLGCGNKILEGYENLDLYSTTSGVQRVDIRQLPYPDASVDEILAEDILEHFGRLEWRKILAEWVRVLKPGGTITIQSPDMIRLADALSHAGNASDDEKWEAFNRRIFGGQGDGVTDGKGMYHYTGFSVAFLLRHCERVHSLSYVRENYHNYNFTLVMRK